MDGGEAERPLKQPQTLSEVPGGERMRYAADMKLQRLIPAAALLLAGGAAAAHPAPAAGSPPAPTALAAASLTMDEAVRMTEQRYHARVVKAETQRDNGHVFYVLRLLDEAGRVWTVRVDAVSGAVSQ